MSTIIKDAREGFLPAKVICKNCLSEIQVSDEDILTLKRLFGMYVRDIDDETWEIADGPSYSFECPVCHEVIKKFVPDNSTLRPYNPPYLTI